MQHRWCHGGGECGSDVPHGATRCKNKRLCLHGTSIWLHLALSLSSSGARHSLHERWARNIGIFAEQRCNPSHGWVLAAAQLSIGLKVSGSASPGLWHPNVAALAAILKVRLPSAVTRGCKATKKARHCASLKLMITRRCKAHQRHLTPPQTSLPFFPTSGIRGQ
ncbi:hypothetical protein E2C01_036487 [Portunus trituberculatus]|uniref:Uncharacterized protein n=1 Tax=Portunus trituberculatus TaxID=210409 RepID=A0A5B7FBH9_PORTR|nr:hypothetical protein [Portunus trituberculatus]